LEEHRDSIRGILMDPAMDSGLPSHEVLMELVNQLGSRSFQQRQSAARQLIEIGQPLVAFLDQLDQQGMDREQRRRLAEIDKALNTGSPDTPARAAAWLAQDRSIWVALLDHADYDCREHALARLQQLSSARIQFNPSADPGTRHSQIARLRQQLVK
jgi:hypothetical protein